MAVNIGKKFYYDYFQGLSFEAGKAIFQDDDISQRKAAVTRDIQFPPYQKMIEQSLEPLGNLPPFQLITTYPGLLLGSGYHHEVGVKGELILGFFFDHSTGLPLIPGSSVKGVLRSAFQQAPAYIISGLRKVLRESGLNDPPPIHPEDIAALELEIFGPAQGETLERELATQDVFYDAVPIDSATGYLLAEDNITPHINRTNPALNPFTEPIPLTFLKVLPGVVYRFDFSLHPSRKIPEISAKVKQDLFKVMLVDLGVGAKTNVGYGHFVDKDITAFRQQFGHNSPFARPSTT